MPKSRPQFRYFIALDYGLSISKRAT